MCLDPMLLVSIASNGLKFIQAQKADKAARLQQQQQNDLALKNRNLKEAAENYRLIGVIKKERQETGAITEKTRAAKARAEAMAEGVGGASVDRLLMDFLRQEGEYKNAVLNQLDEEIFASSLNQEAIVNEQAGNQTYVTGNNTIMNAASAGLNYAGDWYKWKSDQEYKDLLEKQNKKYFGAAESN